MTARFTRLRVFAAVIGIVVLFVYLNNTSLWSDPLADGPFLVAHRGLSQEFDREGLTGKTCTAARMIPTGHDYLENTIPSMRAAFQLGAEFVEIDVHRTTDGRFAVFHDWTLDCRTEGSGRTRDHTLAELQTLDIGYGYTADGGETWPFRGKGVGMMPSLEQVMETFPGRSFFIDVKGNDPEEGALLAGQLAEWTGDHEFVVFGGSLTVAAVRERLPEVRTITRPELKRCLARYLALGWSGHVPSDCRGTMLFVPANVAPWLWGWPNRFLQRMDRAGTRVLIIGDYEGGGLTQGFDDSGRLEDLPRDYSGGIWTDRIDVIGPALRSR